MHVHICLYPQAKSEEVAFVLFVLGCFIFPVTTYLKTLKDSNTSEYFADFYRQRMIEECVREGNASPSAGKQEAALRLSVFHCDTCP